MDSRPTIAEINLEALRHNYSLVRERLSSSIGILAVVKADAYGHGFMDIAGELEQLGVTAYAVAFLAEGIQLRKSGIDRPILILGGIYPGQERKTVGFNLSTTIFTLDQARALNDAARKLYRRARVQVKIDTGMGRLGVPSENAPLFFEALREFSCLDVEGVMSHFAVADELNQPGSSFTDLQAERFQSAVRSAAAAGYTPEFIHIANSAAIFSRTMPECTLARPGIVLYGCLPSGDFADRLDLMPVLQLKSRIAMLKEISPGTSVSYGRRFSADRPTRIASVPVGYADGYPRALTNRAEVLIRGERAPVAGTVCMDWIMVDVTDIPDAAVGDQVVLMGDDGSGNRISPEEIAAWAGTITYEILCGISKRVPRVYLNARKKGL